MPEDNIFKPETQRVKLILNNSKLDQRTFASRLGLSASGVSKILAGDSLPSLRVMSEIARAFPQYSCRWLLTGEGSVFEGSDRELVANEPVAQYAVAAHNSTAGNYNHASPPAPGEIQTLREMLAGKDREIALLRELVDTLKSK